MKAPKRPSKRQTRNCDNKKKMIQAAQSLFAERGYDDVTIDDITSECGLTKGAFYYSFNAKSDLVYEIERYRFKVLACDLERSDVLGIDRLCTYITKWVSFLDTDNLNLTRQSIIQIINGDVRDPENEGEEQNAFSDDLGYITWYLEDAVSDGCLKSDTPVSKLAMYIACTLYGYACFICSNEDARANADAWARQYAQDVRSVTLAPYLTAELSDLGLAWQPDTADLPLETC